MIVHIDREYGGQPRRYADSIYSGFIYIERPELVGGAIFYQTLTEQLVKELARLLISDWNDNPGAFDTRLAVIRPVGPTEEMKQKAHPKWPPKEESRWYVKIVSPYCD